MRALKKVLPRRFKSLHDRDCIRHLESNGSSSMATVCAGSLAMDTGIKLQALFQVLQWE